MHVKSICNRKNIHIQLKIYIYTCTGLYIYFSHDMGIIQVRAHTLHKEMLKRKYYISCQVGYRPSRKSGWVENTWWTYSYPRSFLPHCVMIDEAALTFLRAHTLLNKHNSKMVYLSFVIHSFFIKFIIPDSTMYLFMFAILTAQAQSTVFIYLFIFFLVRD